MTLFDGDVDLEKQGKLREQIRERWDKLGLMEVIGEIVFENMLKLYESQSREMVNEINN